MDEEEKRSILNILRSSNPIPSNATSIGVRIRYRPPFVSTSKHDARGDALALVLEIMSQRGLPLCLSITLAYEFVDAFVEQLHTGRSSFNGDYEEIDAAKWCPEVERYFGNYIMEIIDEKRQLPIACSGAYKFSVCSQKNKKSKMEDIFLVLPSILIADKTLKMNSGALFGVFDGHNGSECSLYASSHFAECLIDAMNSEENREGHLLESGFKILDERLTLRCKHDLIKSGTTASCAYLTNATAEFTWCGDSPICILRKDELATISTVHKPDDPEEQRRIENAGGCVMWIQGVARLNGVLGVSRAFGDISAKPAVSSKPDSLVYTFTPEDLIIFIASDGMFDCLDEEEFYAATKKFIHESSSNDYAKLSDSLVNIAKEAGAQDNLTLISVYIKPTAEVWDHFTKIKTNDLR